MGTISQEGAFELKLERQDFHKVEVKGKGVLRGRKECVQRTKHRGEF